MLEPGAACEGQRKLESGDFDARRGGYRDEFGNLAAGFNQMADAAIDLSNLEAKVAEKTRELRTRATGWRRLYDMSTLVAEATTLETLGDGFCRRIVAVARADAVALRWSDEANQRYLMLSSHGLPQDMRERGTVPAGRRLPLRRAAGRRRVSA